MIIKKFEEQVERFPGKPAVKTGNKSLSYAELNRWANRTANEILNGEDVHAAAGTVNNSIVSLLFEHGPDVIAGIIGALKAGKTYVPLDVNYPQKRLLYMLDHSESSVILTNRQNRELAETLVRLSGKKIRILTIDTIAGSVPGENIAREASGERPAYILYTSGSLGRPKGVVQSHRNILYFIHHWTQCFSISESDRLSLFASLSHDGSIPDIFASLLNGALLYPYDIKEKVDIGELEEWLKKEEITIWHSVPTFYRYFTQTLGDRDEFPHLRLVVLGGEEVREHDVTLFKNFFSYSKFANIYGQTESTVNSIWLLSPEDTFKKVIIGDPIGETEILLVDDNGGIVEGLGVGEIVIAGDHAAVGYWKDKGSTENVFTHEDGLGRLYWTGDLGRLTADGSIVFIGRKDSQVKIRGYRVETGEIETVLSQHAAVKEAVVLLKKDIDEKSDEPYLCAYIVSDVAIPAAELRTFLSRELPDYMVPAYFVHMDKMPLTSSGKIDKKQLPEPEKEMFAELTYTPPTNDIEKKLVAIWEEVLGIEKIGINSNFFDMGGHSLLIITILSKIRQAFNVQFQVKDVFDNPTVEELAQLVAVSGQTVSLQIEPVEAKEYYPATPEQKRMFILSQFQGIETAYNLPDFSRLKGQLDRDRARETFQALINRHETLRTSFELIDEELVQRIHRDVEARMIDIDAEEKNRRDDESIKKIVKEFIKSFDLNTPPLIRLGLVKLSHDEHLMLLDIHHIVADGVSCGILMSEFVQLYNGKEPPGLTLKYRDYSEWLNRRLRLGALKSQEEYWLDTFKGELPTLDMPFNYPRPAIQSFEGDIVRFRLGKDVTTALNRLAKETQATLFMVLLAMYTVLLHKYTGQEDIIVGTIIAGRNSVVLEQVVGLFAKTLALRNYPVPGKPFQLFLEEVKDCTLNAFANQDYPFDQLVETLNLTKDRSRNPLFDALFILQNPDTETSWLEETGLDIEFRPASFAHENKTSKLDLHFEAYETADGIACAFQYCTKLFKRETIELMKERFLILIESILTDRQAEIRDLGVSIPIEKEIQKAKEIEFDL